MIAQVQRIPQRDSFMGSGFGRNLFQNEPRGRQLGQLDWIVPVVTGVLQATPAAIAAYNAKRAADRAKQDKQRAEKEAADAKAAAEAAAKVEADAKAKADTLLRAQGMPTDGTSSNKIMGLDPIVLAAGGLGILGVGTALWLALGK